MIYFAVWAVVAAAIYAVSLALAGSPEDEGEAVGVALAWPLWILPAAFLLALTSPVLLVLGVRWLIRNS